MAYTAPKKTLPGPRFPAPSQSPTAQSHGPCLVLRHGQPTSCAAQLPSSKRHLHALLRGKARQLPLSRPLAGLLTPRGLKIAQARPARAPSKMGDPTKLRIFLVVSLFDRQNGDALLKKDFFLPACIVRAPVAPVEMHFTRTNLARKAQH